jgi:hypothetical protein
MKEEIKRRKKEAVAAGCSSSRQPNYIPISNIITYTTINEDGTPSVIMKQKRKQSQTKKYSGKPEYEPLQRHANEMSTWASPKAKINPTTPCSTSRKRPSTPMLNTSMMAKKSKNGQQVVNIEERYQDEDENSWLDGLIDAMIDTSGEETDESLSEELSQELDENEFDHLDMGDDLEVDKYFEALLSESPSLSLDSYEV